MTSAQALLVAAVLAGSLIVAGVAGLAGPWWALITAGGWITVGLVLLYDPKWTGKKR